jgi:hypothetical protein
MPGLVPGIHVLIAAKSWMAGTSPAMTDRERRWTAHPAQVSPAPTLRYDAATHRATNGFATMNEAATAAADYQTAGEILHGDIFHDDVSDAALERAALAATAGGAMSFPNAPTVSILVICCSFDGS